MLLSGRDAPQPSPPAGTSPCRGREGALSTAKILAHLPVSILAPDNANGRVLPPKGMTMRAASPCLPAGIFRPLAVAALALAVMILPLAAQAQKVDPVRIE